MRRPEWGARPPLTVCITTDIHAGGPWMSLARLRRIVDLANSLQPDLHVMLGDLPAHHRFVIDPVALPDTVAALAGLRAPLGVYAVLGNHDWWDDPVAMSWGRGPPALRALLEDAGLPVLANASVRLPHGRGVWLLGTDSLWAYSARRGAHDLPRAMAGITDDAPAILLAHEPDLFPDVPARVGLVLSGHTHGGQVRLLGQAPFVPSRYGARYARGVVEEGGRTLVVSSGLGCSAAPIRLGVPPELTLVRVSA